MQVRGQISTVFYYKMFRLFADQAPLHPHGGQQLSHDYRLDIRTDNNAVQ